MRMEERQSPIKTVRQTAFRITAYVRAKMLQRDLRAEIDRIEQQPRIKSYVETTATMTVLFALAILASSFGWIGLGVYFLAILIVFY